MERLFSLFTIGLVIYVSKQFPGNLWLPAICSATGALVFGFYILREVKVVKGDQSILDNRFLSNLMIILTIILIAIAGYTGWLSYSYKNYQPYLASIYSGVTAFTLVSVGLLIKIVFGKAK
jgi:uncharacterized membrane protein YidH (DUF202 family)